MGDKIFYLYGITEKKPVVEGIATLGSGLQLLRATNFYAVAEEVPATDFGQQALEQNIQQLQWLAEKATVHEAVICAVKKQTDILPLTFATLFHSAENLLHSVEQQSASFNRVFSNIRGTEEWLLKLFVNRDEYQEWYKRQHRQQLQSRQVLQGASTGAAYLMRKKLAVDTREILNNSVREVIAHSVNTLKNCSKNSLRIKTVGNAGSNSGPELLLSMAFQVAGSTRNIFLRAVELLQNDFETRGIRINTSGPLPVYHFTEQ